MSFAGVSFLRMHGTTPRSDSPTTAAAVSASGYHLLVVDAYSRTKDTPNGECIESRHFRVGGCRWFVEFYPSAKRPENAKCISLFLMLDDESVADTVEAKFEFSFIDETEKQPPAYIRANEACSFSNRVGWGWGSLCFVKREVLEKSKHLMDDCFTIRCDIIVTKGPACIAPFVIVPPSNLHENFGDLLRNEEGADVVFEVGGVTFLAHRCVLAARSTVFKFKAQLFGPATDGATSRTVRIDDMEANIFMALLEFIYTDSFPAIKDVGEGDQEENGDDMEDKVEEDQQEEDGEELEDEVEGDQEEDGKETGDEADDGDQGEEDEEDDFEAKRVMLQSLLVAAEKYKLQRLKLICEDKLCSYIDASTVTTILALAEQHRCPQLKEVCLEFLKSPENLKEAMDADGLEHITRTYPSVLKELLAKFASSA